MPDGPAEVVSRLSEISDRLSLTTLTQTNILCQSFRLP